jgi:hypothetical protein
MRLAKTGPAPENDAEDRPRFELTLRSKEELQALYMALSYASSNTGDILEAWDDENTGATEAQLYDTLEEIKVRVNCLIGAQQIKDHYAQNQSTDK